MSTKREPLISDKQCETVGIEAMGPVDAAETIRDHYEYLITCGRLLLREEIDVELRTLFAEAMDKWKADLRDCDYDTSVSFEEVAKKANALIGRPTY